MPDGDFEAAVRELAAKAPKGLPSLVTQVMRRWPERMGEAIRAAGGLHGVAVWEAALGAVRGRLKDLPKRAEAEGLDPIIAEIEGTLVGIWALEHAGGLRVPEMTPPPANQFAELFPPVMRRLAPPPPKKIKLDQPTRRVLPIAPETVRRALDVAMLVQALFEIGDWTQLPDKERTNRELILDDWRRQIVASARLAGFDAFRQLALAPAPESWVEKGVETKFSRTAACDLLQAIAERRRDNITTIPNVSMLACLQCGGFQGRERMRCEVCAGMFCSKCRARSADLCLADYAARAYGGLAADLRKRVLAAAQELCAKAKLDEHTRNEAFVKALAERGIDVVFSDRATMEGEESDHEHGRRKLLVRGRENTSIRKIFFAALARAHFKSAEIAATPELEALFVDGCLGVPVEAALGWHAARTAPAHPAATA